MFCTFFKRLSETDSRTQLVLMAIIVVMLAVFGMPLLHAWDLKVIYSFKGMPDGSGPTAAPVQDKQGNLYLSTGGGGTSDWGSVVKIDPNGKESVLHSFVGGNDGIEPTAGLLMDAAGNLYGTTYWGGNNDCYGGYGCGVVYELSPGKRGWKETILYAFTGAADGGYPGFGTLVSDAAGNLYGTTNYGGSASWPKGNGTVFELTRTSNGWKEQVVYAFGTNSQTDGSIPWGGVILDAAGNIYGTTTFGGAVECPAPLGCGIVFKIDAQGSETVLYNFKGGFSDGQNPYATVVRDDAGNLYGTTEFGGDTVCSWPVGCGTVFKIGTDNVETVLHMFACYSTDGRWPLAPLLRSDSGILYGTDNAGGNSATCRDLNNEPLGCGVIFSLSPSGKEAILQNFSGADGAGPNGLAVFGGSFYGSTGGGGARNGVVFKFTK
jgi:uncharacterized repeat protein (TIGR03803 family)